ncbi:hypothetical protein H4S08_004711 [Coemansia sp. RSA 1365]|nr:hypothetical protein H4S08_004711 [Coemansia sp. RSA 1365]
MTPMPREHNRHAPPVMMATPWTVGTNVFAYDASDRDKPTMQGLQKLPEHLLKLALNSDSYDFTMEMARTLQARRYNLDEWGANAILLSIYQCYADAMTHTLQRDPRPTRKEVVKMLLHYAPARLTSVEVGRHLGMMHMDIFELLLCYPQKFEKLCMLFGMCHDAREVRIHFLSGLDQEICIMFTRRFPTWLEDGKLDEGYAYVSELQEMFNMVTRNISQYAKFHQAMEEAISAEYGALTLNRPSLISTAAGGDSYPRAGTTAASGACTDSRHFLGGGRDQCRWPHNDERWDWSTYGYRGNVPPVNVRCTEVDDNPTAAANEEAEVDAGVDSDCRDDNSDLEVRVASVETAQKSVPPVDLDNTQPQSMQGTIRGGPAADRALLEPWHIPVRASAGGPTVATWAELDSGASHMLVSESIMQQLKLTISLKCGAIHLAMTSAFIK